MTSNSEAFCSFSEKLLQSPPNILYKIFPPDALARVKVQLQVLQDLLKMQTNYTVIEANNGRFWKIPVPA